MRKILWLILAIFISLASYAQNIKLDHFLCDCCSDFHYGKVVGRYNNTLIYLVPIEIYNSNVSKIYGVYHYDESYLKNIPDTVESIDIEFGAVKDYCSALNHAVIETRISEIFKYGFIENWSWSLNSVNGIDFNIIYVNTNKKTIKYIDIYFIVKNPVGDICNLQFERTNTGHLTCVGPIEQFRGSRYSWDAAYYTTGDASEMFIKKLVITYMDNTKYTLVKELAYLDYITIDNE